MQIAITGATGFLGRYIVHRLAAAGHFCRCWYREESDRGGFEACESMLDWIPGALGDTQSSLELVTDCDAVVHAALYRVGADFRGGEGDLTLFLEQNLIGTIKLVESARMQDVSRFVFISSCAVHEQIFDDRPLDETHPASPKSHYGAHKAAIEQFIHSFGWGMSYDICALRPTGIYGLARPAERSKWFDLIQRVVRGEPVACRYGGKEVHAEDVARAVEILLSAKEIAGETYNCYDRYVSEYDVATLAKRLTQSESRIDGQPKQPVHNIETGKLQRLGMQFGGDSLLEKTVRELIERM